MRRPCRFLVLGVAGNGVLAVNNGQSTESRALQGPVSPQPVGTTTTAPSNTLAPSIAPTERHPCQIYRSPLVACWEPMGIFGRTCDTCVATYLPARASSCDELSTIMCAAIENCPCGFCGEVIRSYLDCAFTSLVQCRLKCSTV